MNTFSSFDGTTIAFDDLGEGPPVVMLHGFAADAHANWHQPKVVEAVVATGRRVITPDARGHGRSGKPHDIDAYKNQAMPRDVSALLDHLGLDRGRSRGLLDGSAHHRPSRDARAACALDRARRGRRGCGAGSRPRRRRGDRCRTHRARRVVDRRCDRARVPSVRGVDGCRSRSPRGGDAGRDGRGDAVDRHPVDARARDLRRQGRRWSARPRPSSTSSRAPSSSS